VYLCAYLYIFFLAIWGIGVVYYLYFLTLYDSASLHFLLLALGVRNLLYYTDQ